MTTDLRKLLAAATPGPWREWGMQLRASTCPERCADYDHSILLAEFHTERQGHPRTFDMDLVITLVNVAPLLLDVVDAARAVSTAVGEEQYREVLTRERRALAALRGESGG